MKSIHIVILPQDLQKAPVCVVVDEAGAISGWRKLHPGGDEEAPGGYVVLIVPGIDVTARWLHLPTRNEKQARAAARLQLEDELARGPEALHLAFGPLEPDGYRLAAAVAVERMQAWMDEARRYGLAPDAVMPDHLALAEPADGETIAAQTPDGIAVVRGPRLAFSCDSGMLPVLLQDRQARSCSQAGFERLMAQGVAMPAIDLLQDGFAAPRRFRLTDRRWLRAVILAGLLLSSLVLLHLAGALKLHFSAQRLRSESVAVAASVLPDGTPSADPLSSLQRRQRQLDLVSGGGPAGRIAHVFAALEVTPEMQLEALRMEADGMLQASLRYAGASALEKFTGELRRNGVALRVDASRQEAGQTISDVQLGGEP